MEQSKKANFLAVQALTEEKAVKIQYNDKISSETSLKLWIKINQKSLLLLAESIRTYLEERESLDFNTDEDEVHIQGGGTDWNPQIAIHCSHLEFSGKKESYTVFIPEDQGFKLVKCLDELSSKFGLLKYKPKRTNDNYLKFDWQDQEIYPDFKVTHNIKDKRLTITYNNRKMGLLASNSSLNLDEKLLPLFCAGLDTYLNGDKVFITFSKFFDLEKKVQLKFLKSGTIPNPLTAIYCRGTSPFAFLGESSIIFPKEAGKALSQSLGILSQKIQSLKLKPRND